MEKQAVPFQPKGRRILTKGDLQAASLVFCFEKQSQEAVESMLDGETPPGGGGDGELGHVTPLARLHPDTELAEIPDPLKWRDSKSYDKCYWLVYKCVRWDGSSASKRSIRRFVITEGEGPTIGHSPG